ncbi:hypothetical protein [Moraxella bovis]|uniref:Uncharacterized protein n=1 Tax=Moraxella bovis TaxID=476 RepID=A0A378PY66_MORBO|nr:hypothetical protein [Moraxella bovis]STY93335.1 Uncharacterised protein [Moraxella bovis]
MRAIFLWLLFILMTNAHADPSHVAVTGLSGRTVFITHPTNHEILSNEELDEAIDSLLNSSATVNQKKHDDIEYSSTDKRQAIYHEWEYVKIENEFDNNALKVARLFSNDGNAILFIAYRNSDKKYQNPDVGLQLSGNFDNGVFHNFLCTQNCLNIDMNIDGKKYQNIGMAYGGSRILVAKNSKSLLNHIKKGEAIKIRLQSITGDPLIYVFEPEQILDLQILKSVE